MSNGTHFYEALSQYPILRSLVEQLDFWDLIQLSRANSVIRGIIHGFPADSTEQTVLDTGTRAKIRIGKHSTRTWRLYKDLAIKNCRESDHTRGRDPRGCRLCSKPVCFACVVKHSFGKIENTFLLRSRALCKSCFTIGNPHTEHLAVSGNAVYRYDYLKAGLCQCISHDGILCTDCKQRQNQESTHLYKNRCAGIGCTEELDPNCSAARVCLWCNFILPTASSRQQYDTSMTGAAIFQDAAIRRLPNALVGTLNEVTQDHPRPELSISPQVVNGMSMVHNQPLVSNENYDQAPADEEVPAYSLYPMTANMSPASPVQG